MSKRALLVAVAISVLGLSFSGCRTADRAARGAVDVGAHGVEKTGSAVSHGMRKLRRNL